MATPVGHAIFADALRAGLDMVGLRSMIDATRTRRPGDAANDVLADAMAALCLGLGRAVIGALPTAGDEAANATTEQIHGVHHWLLKGEG